MNFFWGREDEDNKSQKNDQTWISFKYALFWTYIKK